VVHFVGAGSGAPDLITLRGARLLGEADVVIYAGSLVNPELLTLAKPDCEVHDSAKLTLEEVIALVERAEREGKTTVRLHGRPEHLRRGARAVRCAHRARHRL
jgi:precorrin-4/cobalt-precorrin-4 C11-methyltransferase